MLSILESICEKLNGVLQVSLRHILREGNYIVLMFNLAKMGATQWESTCILSTPLSVSGFDGSSWLKKSETVLCI